MADKHLFKLDKMPTDEEFMSDEWTSRLDYVGLVKNGVNADEVFYNFVFQKVTILKVKIEKPGNYGLGCISGDISADKPVIIDWGNDTKTTLTTPITNSGQAENSTDYYVNYSKPGEYEISIDGWYNYFNCSYYRTRKPGVTQINDSLIEIIQVSSLMTNFDSTFYGCSGLTSIPSGLFDKNINVTRFSYTFSGCSNLTRETPYTKSSDGKRIKLWDRNGDNGFVKPEYGTSVFRNCTGLTDFEDIPSGWK